MIAINPEFALSGKPLSNQKTTEQVRGIFNQLNSDSQKSLLEMLRGMKELGMMPHGAFAAQGEDAAITSGSLGEGNLRNIAGRGIIASGIAENVAGTPGRDRNQPAQSASAGVTPDQPGLTDTQPSPEDVQRAQATALLKMLVAEDRGHGGFDERVLEDVRDNSSLLTLMQDLARLASKEQAAGVGIGMEVVEAGKYPRACELHPPTTPSVAVKHEVGVALPSRS